MYKRIGIIGGMGPMAAVDLVKMIIEQTQAETDQQHIPLLLDNNTRIPDRTRAILQGGPDPMPELIGSAQRLEGMGAEILGMSCNTAHYYYDALSAHTNLPIVHMIRETAREARARGLHTVGLLATLGTYQSQIYNRTFSEEGVELLTPALSQQQGVMNLIYGGIKQGDVSYPPDALHHAIEALKERGAQVMVLGCTELPLAFQQYHISEPVLNPTEILAQRLIVLSGGTVRRAF